MNRKTPVALLALGLLLAAGQTLAGTVYLPHAEFRQVDQEVRHTLLWVSNPTTGVQDIAIRFLATGTDGRAAGAPVTYSLIPGGTMPLSAAPFGGLGMLEVSGADGLTFTGELNVQTADGRPLSTTEIPVVGSSSMVPARAWGHLLVTERYPAATATDLGIANLGGAATACTVAAFRPDGTQVGGTATVAVAPKGHRYFVDAFALLGEAQIDGARIQVSCDAPFFPYGAVFGRHPQFSKLTVPSPVAASGAPLYLPRAVFAPVGSTVHQTLLWVSNPNTHAVTFTTRFIPSGSGGSGSDGAVTHSLSPGATVPINAAPWGGAGLVEVKGAAGLTYAGELNVSDAGGRLLSSVEVPLVDRSERLPANTTVQLMAVERAAVGRTTELGIANLGNGAGTCAVLALRADGSSIAGAVSVPMPALGHRLFPDALGALGEPIVDGARIAVRCNVPFFTYAAVSGELPEVSKVILPAASGRSTLTPTGGAPTPPAPNPPAPNPPPSDPPPPSSPAPSGEILRRDGTFLAAGPINALWEVGLPIPSGRRYSSLTIDFDLAAGRYPTSLFTATLSMLRPVKGGTYFAHTVRGDRGKSILDMGAGWVHRGDNDVWTPNANYHVRVRYDGAANRITWELSRGGRQVERISGALARRNIVHGGEGIKLVFGLPKVYDGAYFPPYNWRFSNLVVSGQPGG